MEIHGSCGNASGCFNIESPTLPWNQPEAISGEQLRLSHLLFSWDLLWYLRSSLYLQWVIAVVVSTESGLLWFVSAAGLASTVSGKPTLQTKRMSKKYVCIFSICPRLFRVNRWKIHKASPACTHSTGGVSYLQLSWPWSLLLAWFVHWPLVLPLTLNTWWWSLVGWVPHSTATWLQILDLRAAVWFLKHCEASFRCGGSNLSGLCGGEYLLCWRVQSWVEQTRGWAVPVESWDLRLSEVLSADWPAKRRCQGHAQFRGIRSVIPAAQCRS